MINRKDFPAMLARVNAASEADREEVLCDYTGPATGLIYDDKEGFKLAEGWAFDAEGNVVNIEAATGPKTGLQYDAVKGQFYKA